MSPRGWGLRVMAEWIDWIRLSTIFTGTTAQWLTFISIFALGAKIWLDNKTKNTDARKVKVEGDDKFRKDLLHRVEELEGQVVEERQKCERLLRRMRGQLTGTIRQFLSFQMQVAEAIPPTQRTPAIEAMLTRLRESDFEDWPSFAEDELDDEQPHPHS